MNTVSREELKALQKIQEDRHKEIEKRFDRVITDIKVLDAKLDKFIPLIEKIDDLEKNVYGNGSKGLKSRVDITEEQVRNTNEEIKEIKQNIEKIYDILSDQKTKIVSTKVYTSIIWGVAAIIISGLGLKLFSEIIKNFILR